MKTSRVRPATPAHGCRRADRPEYALLRFCSEEFRSRLTEIIEWEAAIRYLEANPPHRACGRVRRVRPEAVAASVRGTLDSYSQGKFFRDDTLSVPEAERLLQFYDHRLPEAVRYIKWLLYIRPIQTGEISAVEAARVWADRVFHLSPREEARNLPPADWKKIALRNLSAPAACLKRQAAGLVTNVGFLWMV